MKEKKPFLVTMSSSGVFHVTSIFVRIAKTTCYASSANEVAKKGERIVLPKGV
jgi:hypothetical protein